MMKHFGGAARKFGLKPGSVVYIGRERTEDVHIDVINYSDSEYEEKRVSTIEECLPYKDSPTLTWINVDGIHNAALVEKIGEHYSMHPLILEDIVNTGQRPKMENADSHVFIVLKMLRRETKDDELRAEQISILFGKNWVITFQERSEDIFDLIRKRIKQAVPRTRFMTSDYLAYALLDAIVDHYFVVLEQLGDEIEMLDDAVSEHSQPEHLDKIRDLKKQLVLVRRSVWPLREVIGGIERMESQLVMPSTGPYLRDLYEHIVQVIDTVETYRDMVSGLLDLYHTGISNRMNDIMKVLTIFATIFIPLGFLAGVYGMNFDTCASPFNMPELTLRFGYPVFWVVVILIAGGLLWFFRRKKWI